VAEIRSEIRADSLPPARGQLIARLAGRQHGVVARTQLGVLGLDRSAIRRRVAAGSLHPLHGGRVYAVGLDPLSVPGRYLAAVIACGSGAVLSHRSAAGIWGLRPNSRWLEVTATRGSAKVPGIRVHTTRMLAPQDFTVHDGIPVTSVARTLLDLSAIVKGPDLAIAIDRAERSRIFDLTKVTEALDRAKRSAWGAGAPAGNRSLRTEHPEERARAALQGAPRNHRHTDPRLQCIG
jgi:hypothetical protein